jgi:hypothetical protein
MQDQVGAHRHKFCVTLSLRLRPFDTLVSANKCGQISWLMLCTYYYVCHVCVVVYFVCHVDAQTLQLDDIHKIKIGSIN